MTQMESQLSYGWTTFETHLQQLDAMMKERDAEILKFQEVFVFFVYFHFNILKISTKYAQQQRTFNDMERRLLDAQDRCVMLETAHSQTVCCIFYYYF
jgi:hypothetical protein